MFVASREKAARERKIGHKKKKTSLPVFPSADPQSKRQEHANGVKQRAVQALQHGKKRTQFLLLWT